MPRKFSVPALIYILLSLILLGFNQLGWLEPFQTKVDSLTNPLKLSLWQTYKSVHWFSQGENQTSSHILEEKVALLEAENLSLKAEIEKKDSENQAMRKLLGAPLPAKWQFVVARVMGQGGQIITLDVGQEQGVKKDEPVVVEDILVGDIIEVTGKRAQVRLVNHPSFSAVAQIKPSNLSGKIRIHGNRIFIEEVPLTEKLKTGSLVTRQSDDLVLGSVGQIVSSDQEQWQSAEVVWPIDILKLNEVFVTKK